MKIFISCLIVMCLGINLHAQNNEQITTSAIRTHKIYEPIFGDSLFFKESLTGKQNPTVLLLHGVGQSASDIWDGLIPLLQSRYNILAPDLPGFGRSSRKNHLYGPVRYASLINWFLTGYAPSDTLYLAGHSLGAGVALTYAGMYPSEVDRLILIDLWGVLHRNSLTRYSGRIRHKNSPGLIAKPLEVINDIWISTINALEGRAIDKDIEKVLQVPEQRHKYLGKNAGRIAGLAMVQYNFSWVIDRVTAPSCIIWGQDDRVAPLRTAKLLEKKLPGAGLAIIPDAGHSPMLENGQQFYKLFIDALENGWDSTYPQAITSRHSNTAQARDYVAVNLADTLITGLFDSLIVRRSHGLHLDRITANYLELVSSSAEITNAQITGGKSALKIVSSEIDITNCRITARSAGLRAKGSELTMTNVDVSADTAISTSRSRFDLAGCELTGRKFAVAKDHTTHQFVPVPDRSDLLFSISHINSTLNNKTMHGLYQVTPKLAL